MLFVPEEAILRFRQLAASYPDRHQIYQIQRWLSDPEFCDQKIFGLESNIWGSIEEPDSFPADIIPLFPTLPKGLFAEFVEGPLTRWLDRKLLSRLKKPDSDSLVVYNAHVIDIFKEIFAFVVTIFLVYFGIYLLASGGSRSAQVFRVIVFTTVASFCTVIFANQKVFLVVAG